MVFIAGIGAHFKGDIKAHTTHVLDEIEKRLQSVGSSMDKVLKVNVYLNTLDDYAGMNEAYSGVSARNRRSERRLRPPAAFPEIRSWRSTASRRSDAGGVLR